MLLAIATAVFLNPAKEFFFREVFSACALRHGISQPQWHPVLAYDAEVRDFKGTDSASLATIDCTRNRAWIVIHDWTDGEEEDAPPSLRVVIRGQHYAPPERIVDIGYME